MRFSTLFHTSHLSYSALNTSAAAIAKGHTRKQQRINHETSVADGLTPVFIPLSALREPI